MGFVDGIVSGVGRVSNVGKGMAVGCICCDIYTPQHCRICVYFTSHLLLNYSLVENNR